MTRVAFVSFAFAALATVSGCQRTATNVPEAPAEKTDFAPPEEYELAAGAAEVVGEEEQAPGLNGG